MLLPAELHQDHPWLSVGIAHGPIIQDMYGHEAGPHFRPL